MNRLEKLLLIREGETGNVVYFLVFFLLVSAGMAIGRSTADALFLKRLGIEYLPLMYMAQSLLLAVVCLLYAAFADRIPAERFFKFLLTVLLVLVLACWSAMTVSDSSLIYPVYYLVYEVASEILLVHAALYMNQNMTTLQAKRLAPLVFAGAQVGTVAGGLLLAVAAPVFGTQNLLLAWGLLLFAGTVATISWHRKHGPSTHFRAPTRSASLLHESIEQVRQGIRFTATSDLLRAASLALFFMVIAFYILCYSVNRIYTQTFESEAALTSFFGALTAATSGIALLAQLFITNRAIRKFGVRRINLMFPTTTLMVLSMLAYSFTLPAALLGSINKDALMPAFRNPVRSMFFNVLPGYMQGRARAISVAVVLPAALFVCGGMLWVMQRMDNPGYFLAPGVAAALLYLYYSRRMNRAYTGTLITTLKERLFLPDDHMYADLQGSDEDVIEEITRGVNHADPDVAVAFSRLLAGSFPERTTDIILSRAEAADTATTDQLLGLLKTVDISAHRDRLLVLGKRGDPHLYATVLQLLAAQGDRQDLAEAKRLIHHTNPRLCAAGVHFALLDAGDGPGMDDITATWKHLLGGDENDCLAAMALITDLSRLPAQHRKALQAACQDAFMRLLDSASEATRARAMHAMSRWRDEFTADVHGALSQSLESDSPALREAAAKCLHLLDAQRRGELLLRAIGDGHSRVREAGMNSLRAVAAAYEDTALEWVRGNQGSLRAQHTLLASLLDSKLPKSVFEELAIDKAADAQQLLDALHALEMNGKSGTAPAHTLVAYILKERLEQTVQLALLALEPLHEPGIIQVIRAGFASGDTRHIANASEALASLDDSQAAVVLNDILMKYSGEHPFNDGSEFRSPADVLNWCTRQTDAWLQGCANRALQADNTGDACA